MRVSVFTPTHNTKFLQECYDSIKHQDFHEWIVVYNNGAKPIDFQDERVKTFQVEGFPEWVGPLKAYACEQSTGDILLELDHDDLLTPDALEEVKKAFEDTEVGFVYSNSIYSTADFQQCETFSEIFGWRYRDYDYKGHILKEHVTFEPSPASISRIWYAPNHLRAFRKVVYTAVGGYNKEMRILDDLDLMCKMYLVTKFKHIDKGLYIYRVHGENSWLRYNQEIQDNVYRIYDRYIGQLAEKWSADNKLRKIELGGRFNQKDGFETVDLKDCDVVCDLNGSWAFEDNSVGVVRANDIFEHLKEPIHTMKELWRVLAPGGMAFISVPSTDGRGAFQDPTHVSFWNENSFLYYTDSNWAKYIDTPVRFQATRLSTGEKNENGVCWTFAHLIKLDGNRPPGLINI